MSVQQRRNETSALKLLRKLLRNQGSGLRGDLQSLVTRANKFDQLSLQLHVTRSP